jgi:hypothetical protein
LFFRIVAGSYTDVKLIDFLAQLRKESRRRRLILVWDGLPSHRSRRMNEHLRQHRKWLAAARLPAYAPDPNPVEFVWGNIQGKELASLCADDLGGMVDRPLTRTSCYYAGLTKKSNSHLLQTPQMKYQIMSEQRGTHSVEKMAHVGERARALVEKEFVERIQQI